jgi:putrescine aminotransferase
MLGELRAMQRRFSDHWVEARGLGLLIGLEFVDTEFGYAVAAGLFKRGVLVAGTLLNAKTLRIEPALNIPRALVDEVVEKLEETLEDLRD